MRNIFTIALTVLMTVFTINTMASNPAKGGETLNKLTFEQMLEASKKEQRLVLVDVYTDWCGWCIKMDKSTFQHPGIAAYLNKHFYFVKFNAEQKEAINFQGKEYVWKPVGKNGQHELTNYITNNKLTGYPTIAFLSPELKSLESISSYLSAQDIEPILHWFVEQPYRNGTTWEEFKKNFKSEL